MFRTSYYFPSRFSCLSLVAMCVSCGEDVDSSGQTGTGALQGVTWSGGAPVQMQPSGGQSTTASSGGTVAEPTAGNLRGGRASEGGGAPAAGASPGAALASDPIGGGGAVGSGGNASEATVQGNGAAVTASGGSASGGKATSSGGANPSSGGKATSSGGANPSSGGTLAVNGGSASVALPGDQEGVVGWASVPDCGPNGTTGGGDAEPITVTDGAALKAAMNSSEPKVILVSGRIKTPGNFSGRKNKTLIGINDAEIYGGSGLVVAKNIIVRNIKFSDGSNDSFGLSGSTCIWLDHIEVVDGADGNLDIVNGSDFVTISWSKFYYTRGHGHMLSNLVGNTQTNKSDVGKQRITFHHNWWGAGVKSRKPRVRFGRVHVFNNYYHYTKVAGDSGDNYDIGAGIQSKLLVENNYFDGSNKPITWMSDGGTAEVVERGNEFVNAGGVVTRGTSFEPPYEYKQAMDPAKQVKAKVMAGAGPR